MMAEPRLTDEPFFSYDRLSRFDIHTLLRYSRYSYMTTQTRPSLDAQPREVLGKKVRFLRRQGLTPANLFGRRQESQAIQVETKNLERALSEGGRHSLMNLNLQGEAIPQIVLLRSLLRHPLTREILHVDLYHVSADRALNTTVPLHTEGVAPAAELRDVVVSQELHELPISCLPGDLPSVIAVDLSPLKEEGQSIHVADLKLPRGVTTTMDPETVVVRAAYIRVRVERAETEAAEETEAATASTTPTTPSKTP